MIKRVTLAPVTPALLWLVDARAHFLCITSNHNHPGCCLLTPLSAFLYLNSAQT